jgi:acyl dehydratase
MHYNDITEGEEVGKVQFDDVTQDDMKVVSAIMDDSNPIHFDERHVEEMGMPGLINQGPINLSYLAQAARDVTESPTDLRYLNVRNEANVFEGEDVTAVATATDKSVEDGAGVVELDLELRKGDGSVPVVGDAIVEVPHDA